MNTLRISSPPMAFSEFTMQSLINEARQRHIINFEIALLIEPATLLGNSACV